MRKYIIGGIVGLVLGLSATAYADDVQNLVGQKIQGQTAVFLDGERLDTAIIVDGKSYAPTRRVAEASGKNVTFNEGGIYLESQESTPAVEQTPTSTPTSEVAVQPTPTVAPTKPKYSAETINEEIKWAEKMLSLTQAAIDEYETRSGMTDEQRQKAIDGMKTRLALAQAELDKWLQRKADLEAQQ